MEAKELRIGNWVYAHGRIALVEEVSGDDCIIELVNIEEEPNHDKIGIEPIPLTEEWLVKFGFEKKYNDIDNHDYFQIKHWGKVRIDNGYLESAEYYFLDGLKDEYIKHVHQLQNLYFALTGGELTSL